MNRLTIGIIVLMFAVLTMFMGGPLGFPIALLIAFIGMLYII